MDPSAGQPGSIFLTHTKLQDTGSSGFVAEPELKVCGVCIPSERLIHLPNPQEIPTDPYILFETIEKRRTIRSYSKEPLMRWELSLMLHYTQGVSGDGPDHFRTVPSAGALHPFETYIVVNNVEGLVRGIYRYLPLDHALVQETCHVGDLEAISSACKRPELVTGSAITFIWIAVSDRILWKFGARGWRYLFIEAGHICQNLYLVATALECGACAIGSYHDDKINCALGIDGIKQFCIYMASVGKRKE